MKTNDVESKLNDPNNVLNEQAIFNSLPPLVKEAQRLAVTLNLTSEDVKDHYLHRESQGLLLALARITLKVNG